VFVQTLIRRTDIALKALFLIFLSLRRPSSAPSMPRQVRAHEMQTPADMVSDSLIHQRRRDASFGLELMFSIPC